jgi:hypothetical protein
MPTRIKLKEFIFANADLGPNPTQVINAVNVDKGDPDFDEPYTLIAKSYAERGEKSISDDVLIAMNKRDRETTQSWADYAELTFIGYLVNYGYSPGLGFVYIFLCVVIGSLIFWWVSDRLAAGEHQPKTLPATFLLAFDSVIPGIQLDKRNLDVRYEGWPQWILYLLRALGAVLFAVAYAFLQKRLFG